VPITPALNATLNGLAGVFLLFGYAFIRKGRIRAHRASMLCAFGCSTIFLVSYIAYHLQSGMASARFQGQGWIRPFYFTLLGSHTILAAAVPPLALITLTRGLRGNIPRHRAIARWTLPIWLYVSVTGVLVYVLLYHLYAAPAP
jgi:uncharacterized membrane protein YozB (DUF420 family)